jgi:hypothetical protein
MRVVQVRDTVIVLDVTALSSGPKQSHILHRRAPQGTAGHSCMCCSNSGHGWLCASACLCMSSNPEDCQQ